MGYIDQKYREAIGSAQPDQLLLQDLETDYEFLRSHISLAIQDEIFAGSTVQEALPVILPHIQDFMSLLTLISKLKTSDITEQDVAKVEREVLRYQQDIIGVLRRYLAIPDHDTKEISSFTVDLDSAYVDVYIDSPDIESTVSYERNQFATSIDLDFIVEIHPYFIPAHLKLDGSTAFSLSLIHI